MFGIQLKFVQRLLISFQNLKYLTLSGFFFPSLLIILLPQKQRPVKTGLTHSKTFATNKKKNASRRNSCVNIFHNSSLKSRMVWRESTSHRKRIKYTEENLEFGASNKNPLFLSVTNLPVCYCSWWLAKLPLILFMFLRWNLCGEVWRMAGWTINFPPHIFFLESTACIFPGRQL
jgi:hypothetical protein